MNFDFFLRSSNSEFFAICKTFFIIFYSRSTNFTSSYAAIRSRHIFLSFSGLQELDSGNLRLFLFWFSNFLLSRYKIEVVFKPTTWRVMLSTFFIFLNCLLILFSIVESLVSKIIISWSVFHFAV